MKLLRECKKYQNVVMCIESFGHDIISDIHSIAFYTSPRERYKR